LTRLQLSTAVAQVTTLDWKAIVYQENDMISFKQFFAALAVYGLAAVSLAATQATLTLG
jgi:hypothetical protein